jgi:CRISPR/Cas system CSM-associated protein Csm3 (group 7 of RAMP superfamily)
VARDTTTRLTLTGVLKCRTPLHVGGFGDDPDTDLPLARDGLGRCYIPGTSLAGALRQWCARAFGTDAVRAAWGFQDGDAGHASFVTVDDLYVEDAQLIPEVRDGVGIDRRSGVAAEHIKYDRSVLPRGTVLKGFALTADVRTQDADLALAMIAGLRKALEAARIRLGAAKTRGLGKIALLSGAQLGRVETNRREGIFQLLGGISDEVTETDISEARRAPPAKSNPRLDIRIDWQPDGPLMVKAGFDGIAVDVLPLVCGTAPGAVSPVLPGSSIKGALRTRAEQIVCTLLDIEPSADRSPRWRFLDDTLVPLVNEVFGTRGGTENPTTREKRRGRYRHGNDDESRLGLAALGVDDCYAEAALSADAWRHIATAPDEKSLRAARATGPVKSWQQAFHVAIDRWTGGAAESFLYTVLEPHALSWEQIEMTVDLERTPAAGVTLLLLVLRDLAAGRLPLGFAVNRGMGAVTVKSVRITPHAADRARKNEHAKLGTDPFTLDALPTELREHLDGAWKRWLNEAPAAEASK